MDLEVIRTDGLPMNWFDYVQIVFITISPWVFATLFVLWSRQYGKP